MPIDVERLTTLANLINEKQLDLDKLKAELARLVGGNGQVTTKNLYLPAPKEKEVEKPKKFISHNRTTQHVVAITKDPEFQKNVFDLIKKSGENGTSQRDIGIVLGCSRDVVHLIIKDLKKRNLVYSSGIKRGYRVYAKTDKGFDLKIIPGKSVTVLERKVTTKPQPDSRLGKILTHINQNPLEIFDSRNNNLLQYCDGQFNHSQLAYCLDTLSTRGLIHKNIPNTSKERVTYNSLHTEPINETPKAEA